MSAVRAFDIMPFRTLRAAPLKLLALFAVLSAIPLAALGWLGYRVVQQDAAMRSS